jgi:hypothetical protein
MITDDLTSIQYQIAKIALTKRKNHYINRLIIQFITKKMRSPMLNSILICGQDAQ